MSGTLFPNQVRYRFSLDLAERRFGYVGELFPVLLSSRAWRKGTMVRLRLEHRVHSSGSSEWYGDKDDEECGGASVDSPSR
jgi:hypothetical protein